MKVKVTLNLTIEDIGKFKRELLATYGDKGLDEGDIEEYINDHLVAYNTCNDLFVVEGANGDTDGWTVQSCDCDELFERITD